MNAETKKRCFVISPIGDEESPIRRHADMVLTYIIKPALPDFEVKRGDQLASPDMITDKIMDAIFKDDIAIADLTGHNPNVFYELALRHMEEKPVIHIAARGTTLPFDNHGMTTIFYDIEDCHSHSNASRAISSAVELILAADYKVSNPVTQARASINLKNSADPKDVVMADLVRTVKKIESDYHQMNMAVTALLSKELNYGRYVMGDAPANAFSAWYINGPDYAKTVAQPQDPKADQGLERLKAAIGRISATAPSG